MRVQEAIVRQLQQSTTATYAIAGTRIYWGITAKDPTLPFVRVRKSAHRPLANAMALSRRLPAETTLEIVSYGKTQEAAAELADAIYADLVVDLVPFPVLVPNTSPVTSGAITVGGIQSGNEEDLVSEEAVALNIFAEAREYLVRYR